MRRPWSGTVALLHHINCRNYYYYYTSFNLAFACRWEVLIVNVCTERNTVLNEWCLTIALSSLISVCCTCELFQAENIQDFTVQPLQNRACTVSHGWSNPRVRQWREPWRRVQWCGTLRGHRQDAGRQPDYVVWKHCFPYLRTLQPDNSRFSVAYGFIPH